MKRVFPLYLLSLLIVVHPAEAGSATWLSVPADNEWNNAANWTPGGPPNGPSDTATFSFSTATDVSISRGTEVCGITFDPAASSFTITLDYPFMFSVTGAGITNNSNVTQTFITHGELILQNHAALDNVTIAGAVGSSAGFNVLFTQTATAGNATFMLDPGGVIFQGSATAGNGYFFANGYTVCGGAAGNVTFDDTATAANGTFALNPGLICPLGSGGGSVIFYGTSTAGDGVFTINGAPNSDESGGVVYFQGDSVEGPTAGNATLIANGGSDGGSGGSIKFINVCSGGTARLELFGNGTLQVSIIGVSLTTGSIEGTGIVTLDNGVNLSVGANNLSTSFSGLIQDGVNGSSLLTKVGTGTLTLSSANTYTGGTTIAAGTLLIENRTGSATGAAAARVTGGTLGGRGIISGTVTVGTGTGTGAVIAPSQGASNPATLRIQSLLTFKADGSYTYKLDTRKARADEVVANGVTIESGAQFNFSAIGNKRLPLGSVFVAISNTSAHPISGTFANLADGSTLSVGKNNYQASYSGGDGNDLTLTVVP